MSDAEQWKQAGNAAYKAGDYATAISNYTSAIAADRSDAKPYVNRSIAHAALLNWKDSAHDARCAIQLDPKYTKAHFRFVKALLALEKYRDARTALSLAFKECGEQVKELKELENEILTLTGVPLRPKSTDFEVIGELGDGNFSKVYKTYLKSTRQVFAIKAIERVVIDRMKRRHPNINNEILMEKKNLHKLNHPGIATLYATFQDAGTLYFMNEYIGGGDLWTNLHEIIYEKVAAVTGSINLSEADFLDAQSVRKGVTGAQLGLHWSQLRWYFAQMISAVEHMHRRGVVHRDIKPENIMITEQGYLKFVDFGTSKDLIDTELNGPEFVGTPEYMSPGTVKVKGQARVGIEADLWALGVTLFQMALGYTTFAAPSPFLTFLRIKRGKVMIPSWVPVPLAALIRLLLTKDDAERVQLASDGTASPKLLGYPSAAAAVRNAEKVTADDAQTLCYDALRRHSFFTQWAEAVTLPNVLAYRQSLRQRANLPSATADDDNAVTTLTTAYRTVQAASDPFTRLSSVQHIFTHMQTLRTTALGEDTEHLRMVVTATRDRATDGDATTAAATAAVTEHVPPPCRVPSLHDLCLHAVADAAVTVAYACAANGGVRPVATHPWMQRFHLATPQPLSYVDRQRIMHILDRQQKLQIPSVYRLFFSSLPEARCQRANVDTREVVGLNRSLQGHYNKPFQFAYVTNPRIGQSYTAATAAAGDDVTTVVAAAEEDAGEVQLRQTIAALNKLRPRLVVIAGDLLAPTVSTATTTTAAVVRKGYLDRLRKLLARVSDTIAVLLVPSPSDVGVHVDNVTATVSQWDTQRLAEYRNQFGAEYYGFWFEGMRGLVLNSSLFFHPAADTMHPSDRVAWAAAQTEQLRWLEEELEQAKLCATSIVLFTYHRWYVRDVDEDHDPSDSSGSDSGSGSGGVCIPKAVRLQVLAWARHHKVRFVCSAATAAATAAPSTTRPFATQARAYRVAEQQREDDERRQQAAADAAAEAAAAAAAAEPLAVEGVDVRVDESSASATATAGTTSDSDSDEEGDGKATATTTAAEEEDDDDRYFNEEAQYDGPQMLLATEASTAVRMVYVTEDDTVVRDGLVDVAAAMAAAALAV